MPDRNGELSGNRSRSHQLTGVLHAGPVSDGDVTVQIHPDDGMPPIHVSYRDDQSPTVRICLCRRVTLSGELQVTGRIQVLILHHLDVLPGSRGDRRGGHNSADEATASRKVRDQHRG